jgi:hypothetical protein
MKVAHKFRRACTRRELSRARVDAVMTMQEVLISSILSQRRCNASDFVFVMDHQREHDARTSFRRNVYARLRARIHVSLSRIADFFAVL